MFQTVSTNSTIENQSTDICRRLSISPKEEEENSPDVDKEITLAELTPPAQISSSPQHTMREPTYENRKYEERTTKSEERTLDLRHSTEFDEMRRANSVDNSSKNNTDLTKVFFNKLVAKVSTTESLNNEPVDTEKGSTTSLETKNLASSATSLSAQNVELTTSTTSLDVENNCAIEKLSEVFRSNTSLENVDCRQSKFSELSRSNASLESTALHVAAANKYASCFSISRIKAHNIASFSEFNKETEQVRILKARLLQNHRQNIQAILKCDDVF